MTSPLCGSRCAVTLGTGTGRGSRSGLVSGRNVPLLQGLDRELIGTRNGLGFEPAQLRFEGGEVLDRAVDRREHHGGYAIQPREPAKRELAHPFGWGFTAFAPDCRIDRGDDLLEPLRLDRALGGRPPQAPEE